MSSPLIDWTKSQILTIFTNQTDEADEAFWLNNNLDTSFAPDAEIYLNHTQADREKFRQFVESRRGGTVAKTEVECNTEDLIEAPVEEGSADAGSIVAGKFTLIKTHKIRIRVAPAKTNTVVMFSAKIVQNPKPHIVQLFQTAVDKPFQVVLPSVRHKVDASPL